MKTKLLIVSLALTFLLTGKVYAEEDVMPVVTDSEMQEETMPAEELEVNNKICPLSGHPVDGMGEPVKVKYNGKTYKLCCAMCVKDFESDPEKYISMIEEQMKKSEDMISDSEK